MVVQPRLLPMQVLGKQATSTTFKAKATLRMLALESSVDITRLRVFSILSDMGVESGLWCLPNIVDGSTSEKCFPRSMPLGDIDHMVHHVMLDAEEAYSTSCNLWPSFNHQIKALGKFFSKKDHCERYVQKCVIENQRIPPEFKRTIARMFDCVCPSYCPTRWHLAYEIMHWVSKREALIQYLEPLFGDDLSSTEAAAIQQLHGSQLDRRTFWAMFWSYYDARSCLVFFRQTSVNLKFNSGGMGFPVVTNKQWPGLTHFVLLRVQGSANVGI